MAETYEHKFKCANCGLHYIVYSWKAEWPADSANFCPECGEATRDKGKIQWGDVSDQPIFMFVPGAAMMCGMGTNTGVPDPATIKQYKSMMKAMHEASQAGKPALEVVQEAAAAAHHSEAHEAKEYRGKAE